MKDHKIRPGETIEILMQLYGVSEEQLRALNPSLTGKAIKDPLPAGKVLIIKQDKKLDRLYELLPTVYRQQDASQGEPLRYLLRIISEQVNNVEADISQLYDNWFIETCQEWVVPYIGDLIGFRQVNAGGGPGDVMTDQGLQRNKILIPRREVANTIRNRRRKGTIALIELLASDVAGWPTRVVEFFKLLGFGQAINHEFIQRGRTVDLRAGDVLDHINGPFDQTGHTIDVRSAGSHRTQGLHNLSSLGLFVWRLKPYSITETSSRLLENIDAPAYTFSVLGNDTQLFTLPDPEADPNDIAGELNVPTPIRRRAFEERVRKHGRVKTQASARYYGKGKSITIWASGWPTEETSLKNPIARELIIPADLSDWTYRPPEGRVAVDPVLGRIMFPITEPRPGRVRVTYHYGFSAEVGGGEYNRPLFNPPDGDTYEMFRVGKDEHFRTISDAIKNWERHPREPNAVIEITDNGVYRDPLRIRLKKNQTLQIRAANRKRPVIRLLDQEVDRSDAFKIEGDEGSSVILDGLLITGRLVNVGGKLDELIIRHSTLVPGWEINHSCNPRQPAYPSLNLYKRVNRVTIEHSILGSIQVYQDEVRTDPVEITISDSILDATSNTREALGAPGLLRAHARLTVIRSTVFGKIFTHSIDLAANSIFGGTVSVRRQTGCMRFCYVAPGSKTPRRYNCQPDLVEKNVQEADLEDERIRVRPQFNSVQYGKPTYCQLSESCAEEITRGADDESEMGVFHDLYQPQRAANLSARLEEYKQASMQAGIIYVT